MEREINGKKITLVQGDITDMHVDAIVNAANAQLVLGGGVAGAIRRKGGPAIQEGCNKIGGTRVGGAVITTGGHLPCRFVIHAVGPMNGEGDEERKLRSATLESLKLMDEHGLGTIAFPAISTGIYGFPVDTCARVMLDAVHHHLLQETAVTQVVFVLWTKADYDVFAGQLDRVTVG